MVFDSEDVVLSGHRKGVADRDLVSRSLGLYRWGRDPEEGDRRVVEISPKMGLEVKRRQSEQGAADRTRKDRNGGRGTPYSVWGLGRREQYSHPGATHGRSLVSVKGTRSRLQRIARFW